VRFPHFISGVLANEVAREKCEKGSISLYPSLVVIYCYFLSRTTSLSLHRFYHQYKRPSIVSALLSFFFVPSRKKRQRNCLGIGFTVFLVTNLSRFVLLTPNNRITHCLTAETKLENQLLSELDV
jgi:hypothetical protein